MTDPTLAERAEQIHRAFPDGVRASDPPPPPVDRGTVVNLLKYGGAACLSMLVGMLPVLIAQLEGSDPINWRPILAAGLTALLTAITATGVTSRFTRVGSEHVAAQVDALKARGVARRDMVVSPREGSRT